MNKIDKAFIAFHQANPHVYQEILKYANQIWQAGHRSFGMGAIFERIRWDYAIRTTGVPFKLNNNYRSRYAKLIERDYPRTQGFFKCRGLDSNSIFALPYHKNPHAWMWP